MSSPRYTPEFKDEALGHAVGRSRSAAEAGENRKICAKIA